MMCKVKLLAIAVVLLSFSPLVNLAQVCPPIPTFQTLDGEIITTVDFARGRWALGFIVIPGCHACEEVVKWFGRAAKEFPEIHFLLITSEDTPDLKGIMRTHAPEVQILLDPEHLLATWIEVERVPTVFLSVEGIFITRLEWPFSEGELVQEIAKSLLIEIESPDPRELLGQPAPEFSSVDLEGNEVELGDLPQPLLLVFFEPRCPPCWDALPALAGLSGEVALGVVIKVKEPELPLSEAHQEQLRLFLQIAEERGKERAAVILDRWTDEKGFRITRAYKVGTIPTYILIDGRGVITWIWEGCIEVQDLQDALSLALKGS